MTYTRILMAKCLILDTMTSNIRYLIHFATFRQKSRVNKRLFGLNFIVTILVCVNRARSNANTWLKALLLFDLSLQEKKFVGTNGIPGGKSFSRKLNNFFFQFVLVFLVAHRYIQRCTANRRSSSSSSSCQCY